MGFISFSSMRLIMYGYDITEYLLYAKRRTRHWECRGEKENISLSLRGTQSIPWIKWLQQNVKRKRDKENNKCDVIREKGFLTASHQASGKASQSKWYLSLLWRKYCSSPVDRREKSLYREDTTCRRAPGCERKWTIWGILGKDT